jgi:peptidyl-prolyl cis-trans isomerase C
MKELLNRALIKAAVRKMNPSLYTAIVGALVITVGAAAAAETGKPPINLSKPGDNLFPDPVVAKGKDFEVKRSQLDEAFSLLKANAAASGQTISDDRRDLYLGRLLDRLISTKLLVGRATAVDQTKATELTDKFVADAKKRLSSEEMFTLQLKAIGLTPELFRARIHEQALCDEVINREVRAAAVVTDDEVKKYFDENPKRFEESEQVRAAHILIGTKDPADTSGQRDLPPAQKEIKKKLAASVLARARKGEDFARLAKEFSDDPGSKNKGGEYTFPRGQMVPEFEAAAFSLAVNQISDLVTTAFGYHIIKVLEKIPAKKPEFAKISDRIKTQLQDERVQKQMPEYLQKLRKDAAVEILDESLKIAIPPVTTPAVPQKTPEK